MIRIIFLLMVSVALSLSLYSQNHKKACTVLSDYFIHDSLELPAHMFFTQSEFAKVYAIHSTPHDFEKAYDRTMSRTRSQFRAVKDSKDFLQLVSCDSLSFFDEKLQLPVCHIFYSYTTKSSSQPSYVYISLACVSSQFKLISCYSYDTPIEMRRQFVKIANMQFQLLYDTWYAPLAFANAETSFIPFSKNNLWGLCNPQGVEVLPAKYDSIYPFQHSYALVKSKKSYNLLTPSASWYFPNFVKDICVTTDGYVYYNKQTKKYETIAAPYEHTNLLTSVSNEQVNIASSTAVVEYSYVLRTLEGSVQGLGLYHVKTGEVVAKFPGYTSAESLGNFFYLYSGDSTIVVDTLGMRLFSTTFYTYAHADGYMRILDWQTKLSGLYIPSQKLYIEPRFLYMLPASNFAYYIAIAANGKLTYLDTQGKPLCVE